MNTHRSPFAPPTGTRLQQILDEGDVAWFRRNPGERQQKRMYFRGEKIDIDGEPTRYVMVSRDDDGRLMRRFLRDGGAV